LEDVYLEADPILQVGIGLLESRQLQAFREGVFQFLERLLELEEVVEPTCGPATNFNAADKAGALFARIEGRQNIMQYIPEFDRIDE
jgi:hypothetical protein